MLGCEDEEITAAPPRKQAGLGDPGAGSSHTDHPVCYGQGCGGRGSTLLEEEHQNQFLGGGEKGGPSKRGVTFEKTPSLSDLY